MAYLYGSSNVYRHYKHGVDSGLTTLASLELVECTRRTVLESHASGLSSPSLIVASVLANFICDVCTGNDVESFGLFGNQVITQHVEYLGDLVTKWPNLTVCIVPPLLRTRPNWFASLLPSYTSFLISEVERLNRTGMKLFCSFVVTAEMLISDKVHLTPSAGGEFMDFLEREVCAVKLSGTIPQSEDDVEVSDSTMIELVSSEEEEESLDPNSTLDEKLSKIFAAVSGSRSKVSKLSTRVDKVAASHTQLDSRLTVRRKQDNLVFARLKEEADYETNRSREDRVVITGLVPLRRTPSTHKEKKDHYISLLGDLIKLAIPGVEPVPSVIDVYLTVKKDRSHPVVEAKFDSVHGAIQFRTEAAKLAKLNTGRFAGLFFTNSATLATRVRIEIMRAIATKLATETEDAYVQGFVSRPLLHYRSVDSSHKVAGGADRSYTFVDAVARFGDLLMDVDLTNSYARAGHTFKGAMEHYFVVLGEGHVVPPRPTPGASGIGRRGRVNRKRIGDALEPTPSKKK